MQLAVLIEGLRRLGYELAVSPPAVLTRCGPAPPLTHRGGPTRAARMLEVQPDLLPGCERLGALKAIAGVRGPVSDH